MTNVVALTLPRGRTAPTPSGALHVGNARTALLAWLSVRARGGKFLWRVEDLDPPRVVAGAAEAALRDLAWLGLDWDEGPDNGGPHAPYRQSERSGLYRAALDRLAAAGHLFPCRRSRRELAEIATAPHGRSGEVPYPASLRPRDLAADWYPRLRAGRDPGAALRFRVEPGTVSFTDRVFGRQAEDPAESVGDFVLQRRDGLFAYQLAVVVDDLAMGITEVVRGADLLASTARQIRLIQALGGEVPEYAHVPLVVNAAGEKLSKRDHGLTLAELRAAGVEPTELLGTLAWSLGLRDRPEAATVAELVAENLGGLDGGKIRREAFALPVDFAAALRA
jgi:glutamyl-tRNA synthetase